MKDKTKPQMQVAFQPQTMIGGDILRRLPLMAGALLAVVVMAATYMLTGFIVNIYLLLVARMALAALLYITVAYIVRSEELCEIINFLFKRKNRSNV